jgi:hypothetical protein
MKSGDYSISHNDDFFRREFSQISDRNFTQRLFLSQPALVAKQPVNGHRAWREYKGEPYDKSEFDLVEGMWDHEHCAICFFTISDGFTYWENNRRIKLLCDACHEAFVRS